MLWSIPMNCILCIVETSKLDDPYLVGYEYARPCVGMKVVRWQCGSMPFLCHAGLLQYQPVSVGFVSISPPCTITCFPKGIWFSKSQTAFLVHTKKERPG